MKYLTLIIVLLSGCERATQEATQSFSLPKELIDCRVYYMTSGGATYTRITVVRCPNSSTSTSYGCGKSTCDSTVIDL